MYDPKRGKARREALGMSVEELAARVGVSAQAVYQWEWGKRKPNLVRFVSIASALRIPVESLVEQAGGDEETILAIHLARLQQNKSEV
ncbi:hypothetical protein GCM10009716_33400 [Streptomyces sodiiphilus]|uniref:HTH cro/C1-type domain-containing protein n=1 Tax=Streptomyces sodiiphilus TaxID=226217 RepID=A0ABN2PL01_9ACTN